MDTSHGAPPYYLVPFDTGFRHMASANDDATPRPSMDSFISKSPSFSGYSFGDQSSHQRGRRGSAASSVFSTNSISDHRSSTKEFRSSAIASLLDNATARSNIPKPTTRDIPPVVLTNITKVSYSEFGQYLSIAPEYERYLRSKEHEADEALRRPRTPETPVAEVDAFKISLGRSPDSRKASLVPSGSSATIRPQSSDGGGSRKGSLRLRKQSVAIPPLNTVPQIYFDENFHLENPRTFDVVSERSHVIQSPIQENGPEGLPSMNSLGRKALATNAILQEKLSWYMDIVEVHLIKEISSASSGFFAALGDLRELHAEADASVQKIQSLRAELDRLDRDQALAGLEVVRLRRRKANVQKLAYSVEQIAHATKKLGEVEESLEKNEIVVAMDTIEATEALLEGRSPCGLTIPIIDLRPVKAVSAIQTDLTNLRARCGKALETRFVDTLLSDLRKHADTVPASDTLLRFFQAYQRQQSRSALRVDAMPSPRPVSMDYSQLPDSLRALLLEHLDGLRRANHVEKAVQAYRDAVLKETKAIIRRNMPSDDDAASNMSGVSRGPGAGRTTAEKSTSLAKALRALGPREAEDLLVRIYTAISETLRRLGTQQKLLLDVTSGIDSILSPRNPMSPASGFGSPPPPLNRSASADMDSFYSVYSMDISELINAAIDAAQIQMVKVLKVRNEQTARLPLVDFLRYFMLNKLFSAECEGLSGKITTNLQAVIGSHIKDFISNFHQESITLLATTIEKDQWEAKDFKPSSKAGLERILEAATKDAETWIAWGRVYEDPPLPEDTTDADQPPSGKIRTAIIDEQRFILPESGLAVLRLIETYECLFTMIPVSVADVATNMLEFLKLFNSRVCQVILGAGATKSAGLKHITTKHLALASQALSIVVAVIPYVREAVRRHLGPSAAGGTLLPEFDRIKRNYQEHQSEIHSKLISIMSDRLMAHVRNIRQTIDWDGPGNVETKPNAYMETLVKETSTLHKVLSKHLSEDVLGSIMGPVFAIYKKRLVEAYSGVTVKTDVGKGRMLRDAQFFKDRMTKLDGSGDAGDEILKAVQDKTVAGAEASAAPAATNGDKEGSNEDAAGEQVQKEKT
ncbi:Vacuolar protein-sorting-associated protein [Drechslerella dactyloides]|uniref:Vacuolar protein-sorting-associated protein n=1 Tax=Drechslerella dactyloides TaxID=74499 RepID=A0AAD6J1G9_DREDA|nr:Vacuolar protein-sorting-associated protein [Drechslerella dactyloides]